MKEYELDSTESAWHLPLHATPGSKLRPRGPPFLVRPVVVDVALVIFLLARAISDERFSHVCLSCQASHLSLAPGVFRFVPQHARGLERSSGLPLFKVGGGALGARAIPQGFGKVQIVNDRLGLFVALFVFGPVTCV